MTKPNHGNNYNSNKMHVACNRKLKNHSKIKKLQKSNIDSVRMKSSLQNTRYISVSSEIQLLVVHEPSVFSLSNCQIVWKNHYFPPFRWAQSSFHCFCWNFPWFLFLVSVIVVLTINCFFAYLQTCFGRISWLNAYTMLSCQWLMRRQSTRAKP